MNRRIRKKKLKAENRRLVSEYPFLLPRNVWNDKVPEGYNYMYTLADEILPGWRKAFGKDLFKELKDELVRIDYLYEFRFTQIKEKYGGLRLYCGPVPAGSKVYDILEKYENMSETVCGKCGRPGQKIINYRGWLYCICPSCLNGLESRAVQLGLIDKMVPYEKFAGDEPAFEPDPEPQENAADGEESRKTVPEEE